MRLNPILKREITVQSRGIGMPLLICCINLIIFAAGLLGSFGLVARMRVGAQTSYGDFLLLYAATTALCFLLLLFVTPSLTAGSISMERSMQTLDLMLATSLDPARIVIGKLTASLWTLCVLLFSAVPALLLPLLYGGITVRSVIGLLAVFLAEAVYLLCIGLYASSLSAHTGRTTAAAYGMVAVLCVGIPAFCFLVSPFCKEGANETGYLLLLNPLMSVASAVLAQVGRGWIFEALFARISLYPDAAFLRYFVPVSVLCQLALSFILLLMCVARVSPKGLANKRPV